MNYFFFIFFSLHIQILFGQNTTICVNIQGDFKAGSNKIYIENVGFGIIDSMIFFKTPFKINVPKRPNACYRLVFDNCKTGIFFTENEEEIAIDIDRTDLIFESSGIYESNTKGGMLNDMFDVSKNKISELTLTKLRGGKSDQSDNINDSICQHIVEVTKGYPFLGMSLLYDFRENIRWVEPPANNLKEYINLVETLDENIRKLPLVKDVKKALDSLNRLTPSGSIHDFTLMNSRRESVNTFDKRGKFLLILFSLHGCEFVQKAESDLKKEYETLKGLNFEILEVNMSFAFFDFDKKYLQDIRSVYDYPWNNVYLFKDKNGIDIRRTYNVHSCPRTLLYTPDGILLDVNPSIENILKQLKLNKK